MKVSLTDLSIWHGQHLGKPDYDPDFRFFYGAAGAWQITRYKDVEAVLADHTTFSSEYLPKQVENILTRNFNMADPPRHKIHRAMTNKVLSASIIATQENTIGDVCNDLLQPLLEKEEMDFVADFAILLPHRVVSKLFGFPDKGHEQIRTWIMALAGVLDDPGIVERCIAEITDFFMEQIAEKERAPQKDVLSQLLITEVEGQKLNYDDIIALSMALFLGAYESTKCSLTNALYVFVQTPGVQEHLSAKPDDIPKAVAESLRLLPPIQGLPRIATKNTTIAGTPVLKGDMINVWLSTANRDGEIFADPHVFDINRSNLNQALSFGHGIHYCVGAPLSRLETRMAFESIFQCMTDITIKGDAILQLDKSTLIHSFKSLPLSFKRR